MFKFKKKRLSKKIHYNFHRSNYIFKQKLYKNFNKKKYKFFYKLKEKHLLNITKRNIILFKYFKIFQNLGKKIYVKKKINEEKLIKLRKVSTSEKSLNTLNELVKLRLEKRKIGLVRLLIKKRNIFFNLTTRHGYILTKTSTGRLKIKGKERNLAYIIKRNSKFINFLIKKHQYKNLILYIKNKCYTHKKKTFLANFLPILNKIQIIKIITKNSRAHNGCRPPKKRRL